VGIAAVAEAAFLAVWVATSGQPTVGGAEILIVVSALAMGLQSTAVNSLGFPGIFTTAATATIVRFMSDLAAREETPLEWSRLAGVLVGLLVGAFVGALLLTKARPIAPAFPLLAIILVIAACSWIQSRHPSVKEPF
jgi:uncharacterized membrane protein YoaK (UPF0700 family)